MNKILKLFLDSTFTIFFLSFLVSVIGFIWTDDIFYLRLASTMVTVFVFTVLFALLVVLSKRDND
jgi:hypothetical protein